ncbi:hypothetical protein HF086_015096 [Spodoptera exigua]|uniref:DNA repair protein complementing XP-C cells homolog n=1 Tax=Spodoptera exigua TaxID=7107 RepID=A0A922SKC9_SPOEX|nr:hypothetical protein HF086_015096 [Spodoptera exigua]
MPNTRKKVIKTVYKDEDSEVEDGDFSDSGSDAKFSAEDVSSSEDEVTGVPSSEDEFDNKTNAKQRKPKAKKLSKKPKFTQTILQKINKQTSAEDENEDDVLPTSQFSVKDLTEADKILPKFNFSELNLSESDSSDDESQKVSNKKPTAPVPYKEPEEQVSTSDHETAMEYKDVWSNNIQDNSEEIAKKAFLELEQHKNKIEEAKASLLSYAQKLSESKQETNVKDLLALGEEAISTEPSTSNVKKKTKSKKKKDDSDSELEDWEEVKESKGISPQGLQLFVEFPDAVCRKSKKVDVEMMMKRKINRVKKEYQVYMHKVHVLCWLGHGNFVSRVLNDQELMAAVLTLVPSKECYPGERVDMKYVEQITSWYKDKLKFKQDKHEDKFKPKAPPLKVLLLDQIKNKTVTSKKYLVFILVTMLRALGLQCRVMLNFVTLPKKPPSSELCSLSTKPKEEKKDADSKAKAGTSEIKTGSSKAKTGTSETKASTSKAKPSNIKSDEKQEKKPGPSHSKPKRKKIAQVDGCDDDTFIDSEDDNIMQVDGNDDGNRKTRSSKRTKISEAKTETSENEDISPPKIPKKGTSSASPVQPTLKIDENNVSHGKKKTVEEVKSKETTKGSTEPSKSLTRGEKIKEEDQSKKSPTKNLIPSRSLTRSQKLKAGTSENTSEAKESSPTKSVTRGQAPKTQIGKTLSPSGSDKGKDQELNIQRNSRTRTQKGKMNTENITEVPKISVTDENAKEVSSKYFEDIKPKTSRLSRKRSQTANPKNLLTTSKEENKGKVSKPNARTHSAPDPSMEKSKYFESPTKKSPLKRSVRQIKKEIKAEDSQRVSHRDLAKTNKGKGDVTADLVNIIKSRVKDAKLQSKKGLVKGKIKKESDEDSDYLPVEESKKSDSDDDFKETKISPKPSTSRKIDRRVLSSASGDEPSKKKGMDVWCEIFVEELEQWICVDVVKGKVHSTGDIYNNATHPICYIVGWDNNNYVKDLTRKYVPHWNTITRKLRAEPDWWETALRPWRGPRTARDREEDEYLDKMQLEAPLPKSVAEYKNHPLYALKRHLLKFEAIYPPDAAVLGYVRGEPVYARECVYVCRSRDIWLKEAKVVKLGEKPYKIVKARPKWDKLSCKIVDGGLLEVFGPWQVQDYEPPTAENGIVPRNAYGNVELFKECMLPKGTVLIKLPNLMRVAKKLNIDCAPAMTGFEYSGGGYSHPVYDGFVVCKEFEEIITEAWLKDQEEQERKEIQKIESRVYGNWKRLIRGLMIRERLKMKYGFEEPSTETTKQSKGPRLVVKKKS